MPRAPEPDLPGITRRDIDNVAVTLPGKHLDRGVAAGPLLLHDFDFDGTPVPTAKLHFHELSPGVLEIRSLASVTGIWRFHIADAANYYGLGERFNALNHAHTIVRNYSQDNAIAKGSSTYKPMPFFMSTTGYGLWVDTTAEATFDMNASSNQDIIVDVTGNRFRVVLFLGPQFPTILEHFTALAGRAVLPPYWAFAPWKSRDVHQDDAEVREDVDRMRSLGLPASVILIDSPWACAYNTYKFNPKQFTDAPAMVQHLHEQGYKLVLWHTSWINSRSDTPHEPGFADKIPPMAENYAEAAEKGYFVKNENNTPWVGRWWKGEGSLIDFTNPQAKHWWQDQLRQAIAAGADGFKDDDAEGNFVADAKFADGTDPRVMRNRYAVLYNNAVEELIQKDLKGNGVLFARSVTQGANGIGFLWGGDNEASFSRKRAPNGSHRRPGRRPQRHAPMGQRSRRLPRHPRHPQRPAPHALDRVLRLLARHGSHVHRQHQPVELRRERRRYQSSGRLSQVLHPPHEPLPLPLRRRPGGRGDRHASHACPRPQQSG